MRNWYRDKRKTWLLRGATALCAVTLAVSCALLVRYWLDARHTQALQEEAARSYHEAQAS